MSVHSLNKALLFSVGNALENEGNNNPICADKLTLEGGKVGEYQCNTPMSGKFINIRMPDNSRILTLCEVKVYGDKVGECMAVRVHFVKLPAPHPTQIGFHSFCVNNMQIK